MAESSKPIICSALATVPPGHRRYRVRGLIVGRQQPVMYILAKSEDEAKTAYVSELGLQDQADIRFVVGVTPN